MTIFSPVENCVTIFSPIENCVTIVSMGENVVSHFSPIENKTTYFQPVTFFQWVIIATRHFQWVKIAVPANLRSRNLTMAQRHHINSALHTVIYSINLFISKILSKNSFKLKLKAGKNIFEWADEIFCSE